MAVHRQAKRCSICEKSLEKAIYNVSTTNFYGDGFSHWEFIDCDCPNDLPHVILPTQEEMDAKIEEVEQKEAVHNHLKEWSDLIKNQEQDKIIEWVKENYPKFPVSVDSFPILVEMLYNYKNHKP